MSLHDLLDEASTLSPFLARILFPFSLGAPLEASSCPTSEFPALGVFHCLHARLGHTFHDEDAHFVDEQARHALDGAGPGAYSLILASKHQAVLVLSRGLGVDNRRNAIQRGQRLRERMVAAATQGKATGEVKKSRLGNRRDGRIWRGGRGGGRGRDR